MDDRCAKERQIEKGERLNTSNDKLLGSRAEEHDGTESFISRPSEITCSLSSPLDSVKELVRMRTNDHHLPFDSAKGLEEDTLNEENKCWSRVGIAGRYTAPRGYQG
jgi:hypothetical protein